MTHITKKWHSLSSTFDDLVTDNYDHTITIQREAIPIILVPGIMGTALRNKKSGEIVWDPRQAFESTSRFYHSSPAVRRRKLIGPPMKGFDTDYLEVDNKDPIGDGLHSFCDPYWINESKIEDTYAKYIKRLKDDNWGALNKVFEFPVYGFGYNWTDSSDKNGRLLQERIDEIIKEAKDVTGLCKKVIIITHSMGGFVARSASELHGARDKILGIIHGVQPVTGAPLVYSKMKIGNPAGFFRMSLQARVLGKSAKENVPILGNSPGGLELLPSNLYNNGKPWLHLYDENNIKIEGWSLPKNGNPFDEIYRKKGTALESAEKPDRYIWGLTDPDLLCPGASWNSGFMGSGLEEYLDECKIRRDENKIRQIERMKKTSKANMLSNDVLESPWEQYSHTLDTAENFQKKLADKLHPHTYTFHGTNNKTYDRIDLFRKEIKHWYSTEKTYKSGHFRGKEIGFNDYFIELKEKEGDGDGIVPIISSRRIDNKAKYAFKSTELEHQSAFKDDKEALDFTISSIYDMCRSLLANKRGWVEAGERIHIPKGSYFDYENETLKKIPEGSYYDFEDNKLKETPEGSYFNYDEGVLKKITKNDDLIL